MLNGVAHYRECNLTSAVSDCVFISLGSDEGSFQRILFREPTECLRMISGTTVIPNWSWFAVGMNTTFGAALMGGTTWEILNEARSSVAASRARKTPPASSATMGIGTKCVWRKPFSGKSRSRESRSDRRNKPARRDFLSLSRFGGTTSETGVCGQWVAVHPRAARSADAMQSRDQPIR